MDGSCGVLAGDLFSLPATAIRPVVMSVSVEVANSLLNPLLSSSMNLVNEQNDGEGV